MNGYAVQDAWIKHARQQAAKATEISAERFGQAQAAVLDRMPDMVTDGVVDGFAVLAYLSLKAEGHDPTPAAVRRRRREHRLPSGRTVAQAEREGWDA